MPLLHLLILALVQGVTEFLPVSSSGHLVAAWAVFDSLGWPVPEQAPSDRLVLDVAVHVGTLLAVCFYFWRDLAAMGAGLLRLLLGRPSPGARLLFYVLVGTLPLFLAGYLFKDAIVVLLRDLRVVAWASIGFGLLLWLADRMALTVRRLEHLTLGGALFVGVAQVLALVPGTSRSGITMTAARFLGFERVEAARFSLLLAIPAIIGAGALAGVDLYESGDPRLGLDALIAALVAFLVALAAIALMMRWLRRAGFLPFVVYRILFGIALLVWASELAPAAG
ncbi:MAG TPA: undecaprenyl-diphosphate phosphatase [Kiloniellales bacterium]|nr:undecaprenyl-diphosphate phosphatase [Kiloniellales bacterium]